MDKRGEGGGGRGGDRKKFFVLGGFFNYFFPGSTNWSSWKLTLFPVFPLQLNAGALTRAGVCSLARAQRGYLDLLVRNWAAHWQWKLWECWNYGSPEGGGIWASKGWVGKTASFFSTASWTLYARFWFPFGSVAVFSCQAAGVTAMGWAQMAASRGSRAWRDISSPPPGCTEVLSGGFKSYWGCGFSHSRGT